MGVAVLSNVNLNENIYNNIHRPRMSGKPLYATIGDTKGEDGQVYVDNIGTYNSPKNIKAIYGKTTMQGNSVDTAKLVENFVIKYHTGYITKSNKGSTTESYFTENLMTNSIFKAIYNFNINCNQYQVERAINSKAKRPTQYKYSGVGLGVTAYPYVLNNVESIVLGAECLFIEEDKQYMQEIYQAIGCNNYDNETILKAVVNIISNRSTGLRQCNCIKDLFSKHNNIKDLAKRYPRLKRIAIAIGDYDNANIKELNDETLSQIGSQTVVFYCDFRGSNSSTDEFVVADTTYKFDKLVLKEYVARYKAKVQEEITANNGVNAEQILDDVDSDKWIRDHLRNLKIGDKYKKVIFGAMVKADAGIYGDCDKYLESLDKAIAAEK